MGKRGIQDDEDPQMKQLNCPNKAKRSVPAKMSHGTLVHAVKYPLECQNRKRAHITIKHSTPNRWWAERSVRAKAIKTSNKPPVNCNIDPRCLLLKGERELVE